MKISVDSLNRYLEKDLKTDEMVETFLKTEVEVEQILKSNSFDKMIVVGEIIRISKHSNADKLSLVKVNVAGAKILDIVCGAKNIAIGQKVPVALIGARLSEGLTIKKTNIRGEESSGMLCSANELGIGSDDQGIMVLDEGCQVGQSLRDLWPETDVLDIKTPANRWDYLSLIGLAREVSVFCDKTNNRLKLPVQENITFASDQIIKITDKNLCPRFLSVKLKIRPNCPSPKWLVDLLENNDLRSVNSVVDVLNFVMLETGQPSHAYDAKKLSGGLSTRLAQKTEKFTALDGSAMRLDQNDLVVADKKGAVALAGVIGGKDSEIDEKSTEIILEVANFDKSFVRRSALRHGKRTEASARFEKGLPLPLAPYAFKRIIYLLKEIAGAELVSIANDQLYAWPWEQHIGLRIRKAEKIIGTEIDEKLVSSGLKKLGFEVEHFSITKEARKHLSKPYKWGANYKQDGTDAFDCSYLTDYIYSQIGINIGHTAYSQYKSGKEVGIDDIKPGDSVFYSGKWDKLKSKDRGDVGHCGVYVGNQKVIAATEYIYKGNKWEKLDEPSVIEVGLSDFTENPGYKGARRYINNFNHILAIKCPWWRTDVRIEEDLIEEVVKLIGYDNIEGTIAQIDPAYLTENQTLSELMEMRKALAHAGLTEVFTYSLIGKSMITDLGLKTADHLSLANPLTTDQEYLRTSLLASFLQVVRANIYDRKSYSFFEISKLHLKRARGSYPADESWVIAIACYGENSLAKVKGAVDYLAQYFRVDFNIKPLADQNRTFINNRCGKITLEKNNLGEFGQIDYQLSDKYDVDSEISYAQINLDYLLRLSSKISAQDLPKYQLISRDITLVVGSDDSWQEIQDIVCKISGVISCEFVSDYNDQKMLKSKKKSVSFRVSLDLGAKAESSNIEEKISQIINKLGKSLSGLKIK